MSSWIRERDNTTFCSITGLSGTGIASGCAQSALSEHHIKRTRYAYHLQCVFTCLSTIYILLTIPVPMDHMSQNNFGSNSPELKICKCDSVLSNRPCDTSALEPCNHSESDIMTFLHIAHAAGLGYQRV